MKLAEYACHDAIGLADLVRDGQITPRELAALVIEAVAAVNPAINAVIATFDERLEQLGDRPERPDAPLAGVPYLLKDLGASEAGRVQEWGSRLCAGMLAEKTSYLIEKFQRAGLVSLGRSAVPEFGVSINTESVLTGSTSTPWNPEHIAGGSSGGAAAAVAAGIVPIAHASDIGGSIRIPAHCCGVVGLKPTRGRTSIGPHMHDLPLGCMTEFINSRTLRDTAAVLDAVEGPGTGEGRTVPLPVRPFLEELTLAPPRLRVALMTASFDESTAVDSDVVAVTQSAGQLLREMGHEVEETVFRFDYGAVAAAFATCFGALAVHVLDQMSAASGRPLDETTLEPLMLWSYEQARGTSAIELYEGYEQLTALRETAGLFFESCDLLVTPTLPFPAPRLGSFDPDPATRLQQEDVLAQFTWPFNVTGQPALSLPLGQSQSGLPIGVQLVGRFADEATLFRVGARLEEELPWRGRVPPVHVSRTDARNS